MLLHIVNKSPFERDALQSCLRHLEPNAGVLLIEDGVYAATQGTPFSDSIARAMKDVSVYALAPDVSARGLSTKLISGIILVDYTGFVDLIAKYDATQSWL